MAGLERPVAHNNARVLVVPKGAARVDDVRASASLVDGADVILTEDGRLLKSRWTSRGW